MLSDIFRSIGLGIAASQGAAALRAAVRRVVARVALVLVALAALLTGVAYLFDTAYGYAVRALGPVQGGLAIGGGLIVVALAMFALAMRRKTRAKATSGADPLSVSANQFAATIVALVLLIASIAAHHRAPSERATS